MWICIYICDVSSATPRALVVIVSPPRVSAAPL